MKTRAFELNENIGDSPHVGIVAGAPEAQFVGKIPLVIVNNWRALCAAEGGDSKGSGDATVPTHRLDPRPCGAR